MNGTVYKKVESFRKRYPKTVAWRIKKHANIVESHLNPGEIVKYAFACQKNGKSYELFNTYVLALTNKRILLGRKRLVFGYFFTAITPEMFNDINVVAGIIWGKVNIDTIKEFVTLSNIQNSALREIETCITEYMMKKKRPTKSEITLTKNE